MAGATANPTLSPSGLLDFGVDPMPQAPEPNKTSNATDTLYVEPGWIWHGWQGTRLSTPRDAQSLVPVSGTCACA